MTFEEYIVNTCQSKTTKSHGLTVKNKKNSITSIITDGDQEFMVVDFSKFGRRMNIDKADSKSSIHPDNGSD